MKARVLLLVMGCAVHYMGLAQKVSGQYTTEWQCAKSGKSNLVNLLRLQASIPMGRHSSFGLATIHIVRAHGNIVNDYQTFSNIEEENCLAAIALLGYTKEWEHYKLFAGVRNVNEDFFTSACTALFTNSSCGIFPTLSASYPIANYPMSGLTLFFEAHKGAYRFRNALYNGRGYNGWTRDNLPFTLNPKNDGVFDVAEFKYSIHHSSYFVGAAYHSALRVANMKYGSMAECRQKASAVWWIYAEQNVGTYHDGSLNLMAQYSENTDVNAGCHRYAEIGCVYNKRKMNVGISLQYAHFKQGEEGSIELTCQKQISKSASVQPVLQYIKNDQGDFAVAMFRIYCQLSIVR